ncbi:hypothetical protein A4A49_16758 [Nicotiana attenuata]|uniref:Uncharacterized protein n=1 Tax=Nicotiana attenuata TaxID=49451 RepID=A0A314KRQ1_NICAT|nr:hypothetical protein A4A49_16758 [Nicotiana attenuata]
MTPWFFISQAADPHPKNTPFIFFFISSPATKPAGNLSPHHQRPLFFFIQQQHLKQSKKQRTKISKKKQQPKSTEQSSKLSQKSVKNGFLN